MENWFTEFNKTKKEKGLSYEQLHEKTGICVKTLLSYGRGRSIPGAYNFLILNRTLDIDSNEVNF